MLVSDLRTGLEKKIQSRQCTICGGWVNNPKIYLVEATVTSIIDDLNCHVGTIRNAANPGVGQVERNAKVAGSRAGGKVSDQRSSRIGEVIERSRILRCRKRDGN